MNVLVVLVIVGLIQFDGVFADHRALHVGYAIGIERRTIADILDLVLEHPVAVLIGDVLNTALHETIEVAVGTTNSASFALLIT